MIIFINTDKDLMGFQYKKINESDSAGNVWTSYSDLFMGLAFVFLLLYVIASLRTGATAFQQKLQMDRIAIKNDDLANQLKAYESIKSQYLAEEATQDDQKMYEDLMSKLDLLQDEAKKEKQELEAAAKENGKKAQALNKYQQLIRNVINSNLVAKTKITKRDSIIGDQDVEIKNQGEEITDLKVAVDEKRKQIQQGESRISSLNAALDSKVKELQKAYGQQQMSKAKFEQEVEKLRQQNQQKVNALAAMNDSYQEQIDKINEELDTTQSALSSTKSALGEAEGKAQKLSKQLSEKEAEFAAKAAQLQAAFDAQREKDKAKFANDLKKEQLSAAERAGKEAEFRARAAAQQKKLEDQMGTLRDNLLGTQKALADAKGELEARQKIAKDIKKAFEKAGVKADIDMESGDVTLDFGDHYFETNRADLKPQMVKILKNAMPAYAKSLFGNKELAKKISGIEIVGFASPTYKNRVIDPRSLSPEDRKAAEYNLDLSYRRARSIFQSVFNPDEMEFSNQTKMRSMSKVSGKSFFEEQKLSRDLASLDAASFCKKVDCKKSQKVLIKFSVNKNRRGEP